MTLADVKIVDLKKSDVDWESPLTDPANGKYVFRKKVYYNRATDAMSDKTLPKFVTDDKEGNLEAWYYSYGAVPVKYEDRDYYPEPLKPTTTHGYQFKDAVLCRLDLEMWLDKVEKDHAIANQQVAQNKRAFNSQMATIDDGESARLDVDLETERIMEKGKIRLV